jgi:hypothetical protein
LWAIGSPPDGLSLPLPSSLYLSTPPYTPEAARLGVCFLHVQCDHLQFRDPVGVVGAVYETDPIFSAYSVASSQWGDCACAFESVAQAFACTTPEHIFVRTRWPRPEPSDDIAGPSGLI